MPFTKDIARHDEILIDNEDCSNAFRSFNFSSEHTKEIVTGFSVTGNEESLPGATTQQFTGEAYYTPELYAILYPLHANRTIFPVQHQPDGLVDNTRETYIGNCTLNSFNPNAEVGGVRVMQLAFDPADATGIVATTGS
jgi:hypothetical protein